MPTLSYEGYKFWLYSGNEDDAPSARVLHGDHEAKLWLDPVGIASNTGFTAAELSLVQRLARDHQRDLLRAWAAQAKPKE